jgi:hypothetical protein
VVEQHRVDALYSGGPLGPQVQVGFPGPVHALVAMLLPIALAVATWAISALASPMASLMAWRAAAIVADAPAGAGRPAALREARSLARVAVSPRAVGISGSMPLVRS